MNNLNTVDSELKGFFSLGFAVFISLTIVFSLKITPHYLAEKNQLPFNIDINYTKCFNKPSIDRNPELVIVNDNNTLFNFNDDIVTYNTSFYSLLLPYDLDYYTNKFGPNNSSKQLLIALKQLYNQILKNDLLENTYEKRCFENMITNWLDIIEIEDNTYKIITSVKKNIDKNKLKYYSKTESIFIKNNNYFLKIRRTEQEIINSFNNKDSLAAKEAGTIIIIINNHLTDLAKSSYTKYNYKVLNKGYDYSEVNKIPIYNIIERLENSLRNTNNKKRPLHNS